MSIYLVTWDLNKEKPNYTRARDIFLARLDEYTNIKDPGLDSVRFVSTTWTAQQISDDLRQKLDVNDRIFVISLSNGNHQGWLNEEVWKWISNRQ